MDDQIISNATEEVDSFMLNNEGKCKRGPVISRSESFNWKTSLIQALELVAK